MILTENGFITNSKQFAEMKDENFNTQCAKAITKGVVEYFLENAPITVPDEEENSNISSGESSSENQTSEVESK